MKNVILFLVGFIAFMLIAVNGFAGVDLTQCGINNNLDICSQTKQKIEEIEIRTLELEKKIAEAEQEEVMTLNEFFNGLVNLVKNQNAQEDVIVNTSFEYEDNEFKSTLVRDYYNQEYNSGKYKQKSTLKHYK